MGYSWPLFIYLEEMWLETLRGQPPRAPGPGRGDAVPEGKGGVTEEAPVGREPGQLAPKGRGQRKRPARSASLKSSAAHLSCTRLSHAGRHSVLSGEIVLFGVRVECHLGM